MKHWVPQKSHKYINVWNLIEINKILFYRNWNYRIDFQSNAKSSAKKIYDLSQEQVIIIKKYIDDILKKSFIRFNSSKYVASVLIIKKSNDEFRICVDYRTLNIFTIKNRNISPLIRKILIRLYFVKIYNKFYIIAIFNEIRIKKKRNENDFFDSLRFFRICYHVF